MINRDNYHLVRKYLRHSLEVLQNDSSTVETQWVSLKSLLVFMDSRPLYEIEKVSPSFPEFLRTVKSSSYHRSGDTLIVRSQQRRLDYAKAFFIWAKKSEKGPYSKIDDLFFDTLRVRRSDLLASQERQEHEFVSLDEVLRVVSVKPLSLSEERAHAAICFLYLSGMRITAFSSLPADCVSIADRRVEQKPSRGVVTKNRKAAVTFLLPIPELLEVVAAWDAKIRAAGCLDWSPVLEKKDSMEYDILGKGRKPNPAMHAKSLAGQMKKIFILAGVKPYSPHKLRHGHGIYGMKHASNIEELKAVSQNLMHSSIGITDSVYGGLKEDDIKKALFSFGERKPTAPTAPPTMPAGQLSPDVIALAQLLIEQIQAKKDK